MRRFFPSRNQNSTSDDLTAHLLSEPSSTDEMYTEKEDNLRAFSWKDLKASTKDSSKVDEMYIEKERNLRVFSYKELKAATHDFNEKHMIGEGNFGTVYKGTIRLSNGKSKVATSVAIKNLSNRRNEGHEKWLAEVQSLGFVDHPNLNKLIGYCCEHFERAIVHLLVYKYMPNSLEDYLFRKATPTLPWKTRLQIMLGAAQGLDYLHNGMEVQVIFRDFKPSNVLLDKDFLPKLSDFGPAKEGPIDEDLTRKVHGRFGYFPKEYLMTGRHTSKVDIYSFGVVLWEIISGMRMLDLTKKVAEWNKPTPQVDGKSISSMIDPKIRNEVSTRSGIKFVELVCNCLSEEVGSRPTMPKIVEILKEVIEDLKEVGSSEASERAYEDLVAQVAKCVRLEFDQ